MRICISSTIIVFFMFLFLTISSLGFGEEADLFQDISISIFFDVSDNIGYVEENISLSQFVSEPYVLEIPLIPLVKNDSKYAILDVKSNNNSLLYSIDQEKNILRVIANNTSTITINYMLFNYIDEVGVGLYTLFLDLSSYAGFKINFVVEVTFPNTYNVEVYPEIDVKTIHSGEYVTIHISQPYTYTFVITEKSLEETTSYGQTPTESQTSPSQSFLDNHYMLLLIIIPVVGILLYLLLMRRKRIRIEVETVSPTDLLSDETTRDIILVLGEFIEQGVKQSELVKKTGKPKSTISRRVNRLAREGIVEIIRKGKFNIIRLTPKGKQLYEQLVEERKNE
ncbi:MAG: winged helix-turn-helix transcriptional regulator [Staphylothermus sp.]|nr:winged helix-turn-helix transcriptional regulator [Staphylothermus sp.]